jgi:hypothetical protein
MAGTKDRVCGVDPVRESDQTVDPSDDGDWRELQGSKSSRSSVVFVARCSKQPRLPFLSTQVDFNRTKSIKGISRVNSTTTTLYTT